MINAIEIDKLSKSYNSVKALDEISLSIGKGELFGFIGPDGAGKTTLFRILTTLLIPDTGKAIVEGFDFGRDQAAFHGDLGEAKSGHTGCHQTSKRD